MTMSNQVDNQPARPQPAPYFVGVVGGTGSGKTTVARRLFEALPAGSVALLQHDSYYRSRTDLAPEAREEVNYDHPDSLESDLLVFHIDSLKAGTAIEVPSYDFGTHLRRKATTLVQPTRIVLVEGILLFTNAKLRERLDLKIFVQTEADIRVLRRISRDMEERGRTFEQIRDQYYDTVRPMHEQFVEPSKHWADVIIPQGGYNRVALELIAAKLLDHVRA